jgi:hypothetical protein
MYRPVVLILGMVVNPTAVNEVEKTAVELEPSPDIL